MKLKLTASTFILGLLLTAIGLLFIVLTGCSNIKKSTTEKSAVTEQGSTTKIEYRTNTIYTDTGSITTYYRDSLIFSHDTIYQPIDRIVNRWFKQDVKHDTFNFYKTDTLIITNTITQNVKEKMALPFWVWVVFAFAVFLFLRPRFSNFIANRKL